MRECRIDCRLWPCERVAWCGTRKGGGAHLTRSVTVEYSLVWKVNHFEYDLSHIGNNCVLTNAVLQTHLYEDRMFKLGPVTVEDNALLAGGPHA